MNQEQYAQQRVADQHQLQQQQHGFKNDGMQDGSRTSLQGGTMSNNNYDRQQVSQEAWAQKASYQNLQANQQYSSSSGNPASDLHSNLKNRLDQSYGKIALDLHNVTTEGAAASSNQHRSAKHALVQRSHEGKGFFASLANSNDLVPDSAAADGSFLNKTQVIAGSVDAQKQVNNERANRINLHRSDRQRSHQSHNQTSQSKGADGLGVPEVAIKLKNKGGELDAGYYHQPSESTKNSTSQHYRYAQNPNDQSQLDNSQSQIQQDQFYQAQRADGASIHAGQNFKQSSSNSKGQYPDGGSLNNSLQQIGSQQTQTAMGSRGQLDQQHRRGSEISHGTNHKKKVQPQQPRSREESRRKGTAGINGHNKSSETTNSYEQSSQNSSQGLAQAQQNAGLQIASDKFSQLVCQVPQGNNAARHNNQRQINLFRNAANAQANQIQIQDSNNAFGNQYLLGPQRASEAGRKTLVLDLDETLVHSSFKPVDNADIMLPVEIDGQICTIYVLVRPFVAQFLKNMHKIYELVIFTASLSKYAEPLMQNLDPNKMCSYLLFREHCTFFNNAYVKDLTRLGRPMKDVIILDNSPVAYLFQPENAMPAVSWYDEPSDTELNRVATLLERMNQEDDVRKVIRTIIQNNKIDPRQEQLYLASGQHRRDKSQRVDRRTKQTKLGSTSLNNTVVTPQQQPQVVPEQAPQAVMIQKLQQQTTQLNYNKENTENSSHISLRNSQHQVQNAVYQQQQQQVQQAAAQPQPSGTHSRYDSSDTRQRNAALISEELNQRKRGGQDNLNMEIVLSNVQKQQQLQNDLHYQNELKKSMHQNQSDIQQAYQHHKNQILQLKNEIAALKSQQTGKTPRNADLQQEKEPESKQRNDNASASGTTSSHQGGKIHSKTTGQVQRVAHQSIGGDSKGVRTTTVHVAQKPASPPKSAANKGSKQRESSRRQPEPETQQSRPTKTQTSKPAQQTTTTTQQQRQSYKILNSNEIQLVNYLKSGTQTNQRHAINAGDKKQLVVRESQGNNSQLTNTKQIIKLIKKSEGHHSNYDVTNAGRQSYQQSDIQQLSQPKASQPNIQSVQGHASGAAEYSNRQHHPATTKSQAKQHFAFNTSGQSQQQQNHSGNHHVQPDSSNQRQRQSQQSQPFSGQINMITAANGASRGQQASRTSSKTTKNYTTASTAAGPNVRASLSSSKHTGNSSKVAQSSLQTHDRISAGHGVSSSSGTQKRSSSVKNQPTSSHHRHSKGSSHDHQPSAHHVASRKGNNSTTHHQTNSGAPQNYSNLASYDQPTSNHRRERGNSAQPLYSGSSHATNPLLMTNIVSRSSSTTNKNKKVASISGSANFHNLVLSGSHSTKHSTQHGHHHGQTTSAILQANASQRGGSQDRHQKPSSRHPSRVKSASAKSSGHNGHTASDTKEDPHNHHKSSKHSTHQQYSLKQQQDHLQRMQQMTTSQQAQKQQLSVTQRISPGTMLNLSSQYQPSGHGQNSQQLLNSSLTPSHHQQQAQQIVKQNLKEIQVQDMLRLTQSNGGQVPTGYFTNQISSTRNSKQAAHIGAHHSMQTHEQEDFLKKVKLQGQPLKSGKNGAEVARRNAEKHGSSNGQHSSKPGSIQIMHQEGGVTGVSKSSQGHQPMGPVVNGLSINSPKYYSGSVQGQTATAGSTQAARDHQKILNDIMNMSAVQREQKSGSAATSYGTKQQVVMASSGQGSHGHQIKKIRISSNHQNTNGRMSGQSNQSAPNNHKSSNLKRGDSNHSRGSHSSAMHQNIRTGTSGSGKQGSSREQNRQNQYFNQTMKLKDTGSRGSAAANNTDGILSLLGDLGTGHDSQDKDMKNQTAADLFLQSHNEEQFSQTQYLGASQANHLGQNQLREVTRHFYNQLAQNTKKQQH